MEVENKDNKKENISFKDAAEMVEMGRKFNCLDEVQKAIADGKTLDEVRAEVLVKIGNAKPATQNPVIDATPQEQKRYSLFRAISALKDNDWSKAGYEKELSDEMAKKVGKSARGFFLPEFRAINAGSAAAGGNLVKTDLQAQNFIELLRNKMVTVKAGARVLSGLVGNIAIPTRSGGAAAYWLTETGEPTEGSPTFGQVTLAIKHVGAYQDITRTMLLNGTPDVEALTRDDLLMALGLAVDLAALHGSGSSNQPTGIASTSGIGSVAGGTNGLAPAWSHIIGLETEVAADNADIGSLAYVTNAKVRGKLKQVFTNATYGEIPLFQTGREPGMGMLNGYDCHVSNQVSSALTKGSASGVCSAIFFGNWNDLLIGLWSGIDILVDPYSLSKSGGLRIVAHQDVDVAVRHPESFAAMLDALTT